MRVPLFDRNPHGVHPLLVSVVFVGTMIGVSVLENHFLSALLVMHLLVGVSLGRDRAWLARLAVLAAIASLFFLAVFAIDWRDFQLNHSGFKLALTHWLRVILVVTAVLSSAQLVHKRSLFAAMLYLGLPTPILYATFQAFFISSRFRQKSHAVMTALRLRGIPISGPMSRFRALIEAFSSMFNGIIVEIDERDLAHEAHGYHLPAASRTVPDILRLEPVDLSYVLVWVFSLVIAGST